MATLKIIVTSLANLQNKYGSSLKSITQELKNVVAEDKLRNIQTQIAYFDDATSMKRWKLPAVSITQKNCKETVDKLCKKVNPSYIVILGAQDIFPFQELINPSDDEDGYVPSDLPYACNAPFSKNVENFVGPTRVVGRIPDIPGKGDATYLVKLLKHIMQNKSRKSDDYQSYFSISAKVWQGSTKKSLQSIFGNSKNMLTTPPSEGPYPKTKLAPRTHFYNCHGAQTDPTYLGEFNDNFPVAIRSSNLNGRITAGTIVAAECCYGAQLCNPQDLDGGVLSMANSYLKNGAIALFGSSTIAYGPADDQGLADLITQFFVKRVLDGSSIGRATLEARQEFLTAVGPDLDPYELKTIAQFYLLGDPSVHPVDGSKDAAPAKGISQGNTIENRRLSLMAKGVSLRNSASTSSKSKDVKAAQKGVTDDILNLLKKNNFKAKSVQSAVFILKSKSPEAKSMAKSMMGASTQFRTFVEHKKKNISSKEDKKVTSYRVLVVKENNKKVLGHRTYVSR